MKYIQHSIKYNGIFYVHLLLSAGSINEKQIGYAHFLEHLISFLPSKKYPDALKNQKAMDSMGVQTEAWTMYDACGYAFFGKMEFLEKILDMLVSCLEEPYFPGGIFEQEKEAVIQELYSEVDNSWYPLETLIKRVIYNGTNLQYSTQEELNSVKKLNSQNFKNFYDMFYKTNLMSLVISIGDNKDYFTYLSKRYHNFFNKLNVSNSFKMPRAYPKPPGIYYSHTNTEQYKIYLIFPIDATYFDKERYVIETIDKILVYGLSNRLYNKLRSELGAIYTVLSSVEIDPYERSLSYYKIETKTGKESFMNVLRILTTEFDSFRNPTIAEMEQLKNGVDLNYLSSRQSNDLKSDIDVYNKYILAGKENVFGTLDIETYEKNRFKEISFDEIVRIGKQLFEKRYIIYGGPERIL